KNKKYKKQRKQKKNMVKQINNNDEWQEFISQNQNFILDFYAQWCGPCKALAQNFEQIQNEYPGVTIVKIDIDTDEMSDVIEAHQVTSIPHIFMYIDGQNKSNFLGNNLGKLKEFAQQVQQKNKK
ncbi:thioredoxin, putative, partial [Ichthyophthirius multifiliis]